MRFCIAVIFLLFAVSAAAQDVFSINPGVTVGSTYFYWGMNSWNTGRTINELCSPDYVLRSYTHEFGAHYKTVEFIDTLAPGIFGSRYMKVSFLFYNDSLLQITTTLYDVMSMRETPDPMMRNDSTLSFSLDHFIRSRFDTEYEGKMWFYNTTFFTVHEEVDNDGRWHDVWHMHKELVATGREMTVFEPSLWKVIEEGAIIPNYPYEILDPGTPISPKPHSVLPKSWRRTHK